MIVFSRIWAADCHQHKVVAGIQAFVVHGRLETGGIFLQPSGQLQGPGDEKAVGCSHDVSLCIESATCSGWC